MDAYHECNAEFQVTDLLKVSFSYIQHEFHCFKTGCSVDYGSLDTHITGNDYWNLFWYNLSQEKQTGWNEYSSKYNLSDKNVQMGVKLHLEASYCL